MHERNRDGTFADCRCDAFDAAAAHVSDGKNTG
jgi:hypothetical protein